LYNKILLPNFIKKSFRIKALVQIPLPSTQNITKIPNKSIGISWRGWLNDFRTFDWRRCFPEPALTIKEINQLLALV